MSLQLPHFTEAMDALLAYAPPTAKCAEGAHRSASRIRSGALHVISRNKKLPSRGPERRSAELRRPCRPAPKGRALV